MGAFVASATFAPRMAAFVDASALTHRLEALRVAVPAETRFALDAPAQAAFRRSSGQARGDQPQLRFDIPAGPLRNVLAEIERISGVSIALTNPAIGDIASNGVAGFLTPADAIARALEGTLVSARHTGPKSVSLELRLTAEAVDVTAAIPQPRPSSPKFTQPLRDIPQTITVVPSAVIQAQGATTLRDVLRNVTGISIQAGEGGVPAGDNLSIRGFSARTDFFVDGVRDSGGYTRDPFNVEQVEIVKGPSSSYAGRGSTGGSINLATKTPFLSAARPSASTRCGPTRTRPAVTQ